MAGQRRLDGDLGGLQVAHLADQDDVRVLTQEATAGPAANVSPMSAFDLHLDQAVDVVLDRVFRGEDLDVDAVQLAQGRVERGRLARAGGAGDR